MSEQKPPIPPIVDLRRWREMRSRRNRKSAPPPSGKKPARRPSPSAPRKIQQSLFVGRYRILLLLGASFLLILVAILLSLLLAGALGG